MIVPALPCMVGGSLSRMHFGYREALLPDSRLTLMKEVMSMSDYEILMVVIAIIGLIVAVIR